jgi:hypothetical protein
MLLPGLAGTRQVDHVGEQGDVGGRQVGALHHGHAPRGLVASCGSQHNESVPNTMCGLYAPNSGD